MEKKPVTQPGALAIATDLPTALKQSYTDLTIKLDGKTFKVHKMIMMQCKNLKEIATGSEISLEGIKEDTWASIELYLYSGTCDITPLTYTDLIVAANKLGLDDLKYSVFEYIFKTQCTENNVLSLLQNAKNGKFGEIKTDDLMTKCDVYIAEHAESVFLSKEFETIDAELLGSLVKVSKLMVDELDIFKAVLRWGGNVVKNDSTKSLETVLAPFLEHIRLPLIESEELIQFVKPKKLFPFEQYLEAIEFQIAPDEFTKEKRIQFQTRGGAKMVWENKSRTISGSPTAYTIYFGPLIKSGRAKWSIHVDEYSGSDWNLIMGVCQPSHGKNTFLGDKMGWGWASHGSKNHQSGNMTKTWDIYGTGATLTFDLDLGKGTMRLWKDKVEQVSPWTGIVGPVHVAISASAAFKVTFV